MRILLTGATIVLPDQVLDSGTLVIEDDRIVAIESGTRTGAGVIDLASHVIVPGFVDVHVHGLNGRDVLDGAGALAAMAAEMPRYGVTAFCPTAIACPPATLRAFLAEVRACRVAAAPQAACVLGAHLESNFINPEYRGAQPAACLRLPPADQSRSGRASALPGPGDGAYDGAAIVDEITRAQADVAIVTLAPELPGALPLIEALVPLGIRVSLGHSAADVDTARAAIALGACHATHLFNRMPPLNHRAPGLAGAVLASHDVAAEIITDGYHVHPAMVQIALAAKGRERVMAVTDGTAGAGLPVGHCAHLGDRPITVRETAAFLDDGTLAGSVLTMDEAFRRLVELMQVSLVDAVHLCATTPARELRLLGHGAIAEGAVADLVVFDRELRVERTLLAGRVAWCRDPRLAER